MQSFLSPTWSESFKKKIAPRQTPPSDFYIIPDYYNINTAPHICYYFSNIILTKWCYNKLGRHRIAEALFLIYQEANMKKMKNLKGLTLIITVLMLVSVSLSSCLYSGDASGAEDYMTEEEVNRLIENSMGGNVNIGNVNEYDISIDNPSSSNLVAAAKGVLSAVSISCEFTITGYDFFGRPVTSKATAAGAGVIYKLDKTAGDAYIITNYHVVYAASSNTANGISNNINVYLYGMESSKYAIPATFVGGAMTQDLAVLKVSGSRILAESNAMAVDVADSDDVSILETAIAIGNPAAGGISATVGCINVDSEYVSITAADDRTSIKLRLFRIDTAVNEGNSGGGLFNDKGELIGIVNAKIISTNIDNIAYAIPSSVVIGVVENIMHYCDGTELENPYKYNMGITMDSSEQYTEYDTETGKVHKREVVTIGSITEGSVAQQYFQLGDVIKSITIDGKV